MTARTSEGQGDSEGPEEHGLRRGVAEDTVLNLQKLRNHKNEVASDKGKSNHKENAL